MCVLVHRYVNIVCSCHVLTSLVFFNDTATTEIYTRSLVGSVRMCIRDRTWAGVDMDRTPVLAELRAELPSLRHLLLVNNLDCLLYTSPSPRDRTRSRMPSSA